MRKAVRWLCMILFLGGCAAPLDIPLPKEHPAYGFYQTANTFNVSSQSCMKLNGSLEIRPDKIGADKEYEKVKELAPGLYIVKQKTTKKQWATVLFMEYGLVTSIPKSCSWSIEEFSIVPSPEPIDDSK